MKTFIYDLLPVSSVRFLLITIFQKVSAETGQKGLILSQKRVTLNRRNFSLPAPKLSALFFKRQEIGRSFFLIAQFFHERFFCAHKNTVETLYLSVILTAFSGHFNSACFTFEKHTTFTYRFWPRSKLITTQASDSLRCHVVYNVENSGYSNSYELYKSLIEVSSGAVPRYNDSVVIAGSHHFGKSSQIYKDKVI